MSRRPHPTDDKPLSPQERRIARKLIVTCIAIIAATAAAIWSLT